MGKSSQSRIHKADILKLAEELQRQLGPTFSVETREGGSFIGIFDSNKTFVGSYQWVQGVGWRGSIMQPFTFCYDDIEHMTDELKRCLQGSTKAQEQWEKYLQDKSEASWQAYQGAIAAHGFRMYQGEGESPIETEVEPLFEREVDTPEDLNLKGLLELLD